MGLPGGDTGILTFCPIHTSPIPFPYPPWTEIQNKIWLVTYSLGKPGLHFLLCGDWYPILSWKSLKNRKGQCEGSISCKSWLVWSETSQRNISCSRNGNIGGPLGRWGVVSSRTHKGTYISHEQQHRTYPVGELAPLRPSLGLKSKSNVYHYFSSYRNVEVGTGIVLQKSFMFPTSSLLEIIAKASGRWFPTHSCLPSLLVSESNWQKQIHI